MPYVIRLVTPGYPPVYWTGETWTTDVSLAERFDDAFRAKIQALHASPKAQVQYLPPKN